MGRDHLYAFNAKRISEFDPVLPVMFWKLAFLDFTRLKDNMENIPDKTFVNYYSNNISKICQQI